MLFRTWCFYCHAPGSTPDRGTFKPRGTAKKIKKERKGLGKGHLTTGRIALALSFWAHGRQFYLVASLAAAKTRD